MKTRYCISIIPSTSGMRQIYGPNQGHRFKDTREDAQASLNAIRECSGNRETLDNIYGPGAFESLAVSPIECYDNGDAVNTFPSETI